MSEQRENPDYSPLLTDFYQVSMAYSYFKQGRHKERAVFDVFFRKSPFDGEYALFFGRGEVEKFIKNLFLSKKEVDFLMQNLGVEDEAFADYLLNGIKEDANEENLVITGLPEGSVCFPKVPVMRIEGTLLLAQLIETAVLNLTGFASLVATNASRICHISEPRKVLEFGLRRAQGPNGALSASKYAVLGGCVGTSNCLAGFRDNVRVSGTMAHSYICGFQNSDNESMDFLKDLKLKTPEGGVKCDVNGPVFQELVMRIKMFCEESESWRKNTLPDENQTWSASAETAKRWDQLRQTELNAFISYALDYPHNFLALVDTYDTLRSGVPNFLYVSLALILHGHRPKGIRLDSGKLGVLASESRRLFREFFRDVGRKFVEKDAVVSVAPTPTLAPIKKKQSVIKNFTKRFTRRKKTKNNNVSTQSTNAASTIVVDFPNNLNEEYFGKDKNPAKSISIVASNDLHEDAIRSLLEKHDHLEIDLFGIGTHLATCKSQPALGMVYKLVELNEKPCVKFSQAPNKMTYPGKKSAFRLFLNQMPVADVLCVEGEVVSEESEFYSNVTFDAKVDVEFDCAVDLYNTDVFESIVKESFEEIAGDEGVEGDVLIERVQAGEIPKELVSDKKLAEKMKSLLLTEMSSFKGKERVFKFDLLKAKTEACKKMFDGNMLSSVRPTKVTLPKHPVHLSKELVNAIKGFRGESKL